MGWWGGEGVFNAKALRARRREGKNDRFTAETRRAQRRRRGEFLSEVVLVESGFSVKHGGTEDTEKARRRQRRGTWFGRE